MGEEWFAVLPDSDTGLAAVRALRPLASDVIEHSSGRPWLMGRWPDGEVTVAATGSARLAVAGCSPATVGSLRERLRGVRSVCEAEKAVARLPGCFHLLASVGGRVRAQGTLASTRRVFRARVGDAVIAADSARVLARLIRADWDPSWLTLRLAGTAIPFPLHESTPWQGIRAVPGDHWLELAADGSAAERRRWTPPESELPLGEGSLAVRNALTAAVQTRTTHGGTVSTDLSGGMDSTSLALLAARGPAELVTFRLAGEETGSDDTYLAERAVAALPQARHRVHAADRTTAMFAGLGPNAPPADTEAPFPLMRDRGRIAHMAELMAAEGSRVHLTGHGGDELFRPVPTYLHDLFRSHPYAAVRHARAHRTASRWSRSALLRALADRRTPADELVLQAAALRAPLPGRRHVSFGWTQPLHLPEWVTDDAADATRELLRATATGPVEPLARQRSQHGLLLTARGTGMSVRLANRLSSGHGPAIAAPYLDDQVLGAVLSVRPADRHSPWVFKPLLAAAMRETVPRALLGRRAKAAPSAGFYEGLRRQRADVLKLLDDSELARHGLIDAGRLRQALLSPQADALATLTTLTALDAALACETWLRSLHHRAAAVPHTGSGAVPHQRSGPPPVPNRGAPGLP